MMNPGKKKPQTTSTTLETLPISENREIRIVEIAEENGTLVRIGIYTSRKGEALSGATFPVRMLDELIPALQRVRRAAR